MALLLVAGMQSTRLDAQALYGSIVGSIQDQYPALVMSAVSHMRLREPAKAVPLFQRAMRC